MKKSLFSLVTLLFAFLCAQAEQVGFVQYSYGASAVVSPQIDVSTGDPTGECEGVSFTWPALAVYSGTYSNGSGDFTFTAPEGMQITKIVFNLDTNGGSGAEGLVNAMTPATGSFQTISNNESLVWEGASRQVVFAYDGKKVSENCYTNGISVYFEEVKSEIIWEVSTNDMMPGNANVKMDDVFADRGFTYSDFKVEFPNPTQGTVKTCLFNGSSGSYNWGNTANRTLVITPPADKAISEVIVCGGASNKWTSTNVPTVTGTEGELKITSIGESFNDNGIVWTATTPAAGEVITFNQTTKITFNKINYIVIKYVDAEAAEPFTPIEKPVVNSIETSGEQVLVKMTLPNVWDDGTKIEEGGIKSVKLYSDGFEPYSGVTPFVTLEASRSLTLIPGEEVSIYFNVGTLHGETTLGAYCYNGSNLYTKGADVKFYAGYGVPKAPEAVTVADNTASWTAVTALTDNGYKGTITYNVYLNDELKAENVTATTYALGELALGTYTVSVEAVNGDQKSTKTSAQFTISYGVPQAPASVTVADNTATWTAVTALADNGYKGDITYNVYLNDELKAENVTETTYALGELADGTYTVSVEAVNGDKKSAKTTSAEFTIKTEVPTPPTGEVKTAGFVFYDQNADAVVSPQVDANGKGSEECEGLSFTWPQTSVNQGQFVAGTGNYTFTAPEGMQIIKIVFNMDLNGGSGANGLIKGFTPETGAFQTITDNASLVWEGSSRQVVMAYDGSKVSDNCYVNGVSVYFAGGAEVPTPPTGEVKTAGFVYYESGAASVVSPQVDANGKESAECEGLSFTWPKTSVNQGQFVAGTGNYTFTAPEGMQIIKIVFNMDLNGGSGANGLIKGFTPETGAFQTITDNASLVWEGSSRQVVMAYDGSKVSDNCYVNGVSVYFAGGEVTPPVAEEKEGAAEFVFANSPTYTFATDVEVETKKFNTVDASSISSAEIAPIEISWPAGAFSGSANGNWKFSTPNAITFTPAPGAKIEQIGIACYVSTVFSYPENAEFTFDKEGTVEYLGGDNNRFIWTAANPTTDPVVLNFAYLKNGYIEQIFVKYVESGEIIETKPVGSWMLDGEEVKTATVNTLEAYTLPTWSFTDGVTAADVTFASDNESLATVDGNGAITLVENATGVVNFTATPKADDGSLKSVSLALTVKYEIEYPADNNQIGLWLFDNTWYGIGSTSESNIPESATITLPLNSEEIPVFMRNPKYTNTVITKSGTTAVAEVSSSVLTLKNEGTTVLNSYGIMAPDGQQETYVKLVVTAAEVDVTALAAPTLNYANREELIVYKEGYPVTPGMRLPWSTTTEGEVSYRWTYDGSDPVTSSTAMSLNYVSFDPGDVDQTFPIKAVTMLDGKASEVSEYSITVHNFVLVDGQYVKLEDAEYFVVGTDSGITTSGLGYVMSNSVSGTGNMNGFAAVRAMYLEDNKFVKAYYNHYTSGGTTYGMPMILKNRSGYLEAINPTTVEKTWLASNSSSGLYLNATYTGNCTVTANNTDGSFTVGGRTVKYDSDFRRFCVTSQGASVNAKLYAWVAAPQYPDPVLEFTLAGKKYEDIENVPVRLKKNENCEFAVVLPTGYVASYTLTPAEGEVVTGANVTASPVKFDLAQYTGQVDLKFTATRTGKPTLEFEKSFILLDATFKAYWVIDGVEEEITNPTGQNRGNMGEIIKIVPPAGTTALSYTVNGGSATLVDMQGKESFEYTFRRGGVLTFVFTASDEIGVVGSQTYMFDIVQDVKDGSTIDFGASTYGLPTTDDENPKYITGGTYWRSFQTADANVFIPAGDNRVALVEHDGAQMLKLMENSSIRLGLLNKTRRITSITITGQNLEGIQIGGYTFPEGTPEAEKNSRQGNFYAMGNTTAEATTVTWTFSDNDPDTNGLCIWNYPATTRAAGEPAYISTIEFKSDISTQLEEFYAEEAEAVYYDMNGNRVAGDQLVKGLYIRIVGDKTTKILVK